MGMFDEVYMDGHRWQTNDAGDLLRTYEVVDDGDARRLYVRSVSGIHPEHREERPLSACPTANGVLALWSPDVAGSRLLFIRDGVIVGDRTVADVHAVGGLSLDHAWPV